MARIFISTGEVSGDLQGSLLTQSLKRQAAVNNLDLEIVGLGGSRMANAGANILGDTAGIGSVGILESLPYILPTLQLQRQAKQYLQINPPDLVVLIDYMGPNLSIGSYIRRRWPKVPIIWYIAPQVWVWSPPWQDTARIVSIADQFLAIFQEEADYFQRLGANVSWVGHPLADRMESAPSRESARASLGIEEEEVAIALIPASRQQEIKYLMPAIFEAAQIIQNKLPQVHFWIPLSREALRQPIQQAIEDYGLEATLLDGQTLEILAAADLAIAKSGTVNLEIALLNVPQIAIYRVNPITYWLARKILKFSIPFMSPPNLVLQKEIVPELLQEQATAENIVSQAMELLVNPERRRQMLADYREMRESLGGVGVCDRAADSILQILINSLG
ncbi:lipid-A-disaccharide synthase [Kamptonema sp. UHCC 0994]|uniref:lipid-A-disaccharide synthase n=1 Tax=Kamptonema sp. UHCC 0994 TaxID=3031329 RepID=UPI0023BAB9BD|nr:lipid-A-disaccharide synthase [Kamptonema sp. UHCC 0994]MDF0556727.1 lipid-A-disaccharide synthase [Kamptonema sp. UHCC 0994]